MPQNLVKSKRAIKISVCLFLSTLIYLSSLLVTLDRFSYPLLVRLSLDPRLDSNGTTASTLSTPIRIQPSRETVTSAKRDAAAMTESTLRGGNIGEEFHLTDHFDRDTLQRDTAENYQGESESAESNDYHQDVLPRYEKQDDYRQCGLNQPFPRPQHACHVANDTSIPYCHIRNLRIDMSKIHSPMGGENLTTVMGRAEDDEYPKYDKGAFSAPTPLDFPPPMDHSQFHYVQSVLDSFTVTPSEPQQPACAETHDGLTLFLTRYEYVNLYHTITDFWNAFMSLPSPTAKANIVFLDAHAQGNLDSVWSRLFGKITFVQHLSRGDGVSGGDDGAVVICFSNAVLVPPGYSSILSPGGRTFTRLCCPSMMEAFVSFVLNAYELRHVKRKVGHVVIIERVPYVCHPRSNPDGAQRILENLVDVQNRLMNVSGITSVELVRLETMDFATQLRKIREANILIGNHGAGISHLLFLDKGAHVLEFDDTSNTVFVEFAQWKPDVTHTLLNPVGYDTTNVSTEYIETQIVPAVEKIVSTML